MAGGYNSNVRNSDPGVQSNPQAAGVESWDQHSQEWETVVVRFAALDLRRLRVLEKPHFLVVGVHWQRLDDQGVQTEVAERLLSCLHQ